MRKLWLSCQNKGKCLTLENSGKLTVLKKELLFIAEKNSEPNQILMKRVVGERFCK